MARVDDHHVISRVHWGQVNEEDEEGRENRRNVKQKKKKRNYYEAGSKDEKTVEGGEEKMERGEEKGRERRNNK